MYRLSGAGGALGASHGGTRAARQGSGSSGPHALSSASQGFRFGDDPRRGTMGVSHQLTTPRLHRVTPATIARDWAPNQALAVAHLDFPPLALGRVGHIPGSSASLRDRAEVVEEEYLRAHGLDIGGVGYSVEIPAIARVIGNDPKAVTGRQARANTGRTFGDEVTRLSVVADGRKHDRSGRWVPCGTPRGGVRRRARNTSGARAHRRTILDDNLGKFGSSQRVNQIRFG